MTGNFDPNKPRSSFLESGYPTCVAYNCFTGEYYTAGMPEASKTLRGHLPALAPVMAVQAAQESSAYAVQVFLPQAASRNNAQDVADFALDTFEKSFGAVRVGDLVAVEFGVGTGGTTRYFGQKLGDTPLYGFDWFWGLTEDWTDFQKKGRWTQNGNKPEGLTDNVRIVEGKFQDTLEPFLKAHKNAQVGFVHMDADTYESTKYVLKRIVPFLADGAVIVFDEYFNFPGWSKAKLGEASAWHEIVKEFRLTVRPICFALEHQSTAWQVVSKPSTISKALRLNRYTKLPQLERFMTVPQMRL